MANEIWHSYDEAETLYALIFQKTDDKVWNGTDSQFDTYTDADIDKYDVPLANHVDSDYHTVDFPSGITTAGVYRVQIMLQVGGSIDADDDICVAQGEIYWTGADEIDLLALAGQNGTVFNIYDDRGDGGGAQTITSTGRLGVESADC